MIDTTNTAIGGIYFSIVTIKTNIAVSKRELL